MEANDIQEEDKEGKGDKPGGKNGKYGAAFAVVIRFAP